MFRWRWRSSKERSACQLCRRAENRWQALFEVLLWVSQGGARPDDKPPPGPWLGQQLCRFQLQSSDPKSTQRWCRLVLMFSTRRAPLLHEERSELTQNTVECCLLGDASYDAWADSWNHLTSPYWWWLMLGTIGKAARRTGWATGSLREVQSPLKIFQKKLRLRELF